MAELVVPGTGQLITLDDLADRGLEPVETNMIPSWFVDNGLEHGTYQGWPLNAMLGKHKMHLVPAGEFAFVHYDMNPGEQVTNVSHSEPRNLECHVYLSPPITRQQFWNFMTETGYDNQKVMQDFHETPFVQEMRRKIKLVNPDNPVFGVNGEDASAYAVHFSAGIPTSVMWERTFMSGVGEIVEGRPAVKEPKKDKAGILVTRMGTQICRSRKEWMSDKYNNTCPQYRLRGTLGDKHSRGGMHPRRYEKGVYFRICVPIR